jgi:ABC-type sugar transport system permease subunit
MIYRAMKAARQRRDLVPALAFLAPSLVIFAVFVFYPLGKSVYLSLYATDPIGLPSAFVGADQYLDLMRLADFRRSLVVTVGFVVLTVPTGILFGLLLALFANRRLRGISVFRTLFASTLATSAATASVIFLLLYHPSVGVLNYFLNLLHLPGVRWLTDPATALVAVALATVWLHLGLNMLVLLGGLQGISEELFDAAKVDGASGPRLFRHITLPMLSPTLFFLGVVGTISAFQAFAQINILTRGGPVMATTTVVYSIFREAFFNFQFGSASAQAVALFLILLLLTGLQFRVLERRVFYR